jgi:hypothetical protein
MDLALNADENEEFIIDGYRWQSKCTECSNFTIEDHGEYAECSLHLDPHECEEGPFIITGEEWTLKMKT